MLPDYFPAIRAGAVRADLKNNVWVLPSTTSAGTGDGLIYDVLDDHGVLRQRVRLPAGRSIAGFGQSGIVYMIGREVNGSWYLERGVYKAQ